MKIKCLYCNRLGHHESACYVKKKLIRKNKINLSSQKVEKAKKVCFYCNKSDHTRQSVTLRKDLLEELTLKDPTLHGYLKFLSCQM